MDYRTLDENVIHNYADKRIFQTKEWIGFPGAGGICLVTEYASAKEQICHGENGLIAENSNLGPYEGLCSLLANRSLLEKLAVGAKSTVVENSRQIDKLYALLRSEK